MRTDTTAGAQNARSRRWTGPSNKPSWIWSKRLASWGNHRRDLEAVLVEDIEEVSEWMHDAFRDALYRRVELRQELAVLDQHMADMTAAMMATLRAQ